MRHPTKIMLASFLVAALAGNAHAYLDPGTGSYIFQIIAATVLGLVFSVKVFFKSLKAFFLNAFRKGR